MSATASRVGPWPGWNHHAVHIAMPTIDRAVTRLSTARAAPGSTAASTNAMSPVRICRFTAACAFAIAGGNSASLRSISRKCVRGSATHSTSRRTTSRIAAVGGRPVSPTSRSIVAIGSVTPRISSASNASLFGK